MAIQCGILAWRLPVDRGAWQPTVHGVAKSWALLSDKAQCSTSRFQRFTFLSAQSLQRLETPRFPTALSVKLGCLPPEGCKNLKVFCGPQKGRNFPELIRQNLLQAPGMAFLALGRLLLINQA